MEKETVASQPEPLGEKPAANYTENIEAGGQNDTIQKDDFVKREDDIHASDVIAGNERILVSAQDVCIYFPFYIACCRFEPC